MVKDLSQEVHFKVSEEDIGTDDVVGEGTCTLADLCQGTGVDSHFNIFYNGKSAGTVHFTTVWTDFNWARQEMAESERLRLEEEARLREE